MSNAFRNSLANKMVVLRQLHETFSALCLAMDQQSDQIITMIADEDSKNERIEAYKELKRFIGKDTSKSIQKRAVKLRKAENRQDNEPDQGQEQDGQQ